MDEALFRMMRATGRTAVVQCIWVYERPVNFAGLRRLHRELGRGLLGRRIERSPLPFARHRWVAYQGPDIDVAEQARPRQDLSDWADERAQLPVDPERGPCWHLGVLALTDGSTAVSLVVSHCLVDGLGLGGAIADAIHGSDRDLGYPPPGSRSRWRAVIQDAAQVAKSGSEVARAIAALARQTREQRDAGQSSRASRPAGVSGGDSDEAVVVPMVTVRVDGDNWDARAKALGGMGHHLIAGFAAKLGEQLGRRRAADGLVTLQLPVSDRTGDDTRANALSFVSIAVDPAPVTKDLHGVRIANGQAFRELRAHPEESNPILALTPLAPFAPRRVLKRVVDAAFDYDELPVGCSNGGDVDPALGRVDGGDASDAFARGGEQHVTRGHLEQTRGQLTVWAARFGDKVGLTIGGYQPGRVESKSSLRELVTETLAEFELAGVID
ncbi:wax ester/triacylglycerol synthase family O-acyltransferase [Candidatus Mycobacterium methanotrophicum]|uniref:Wax ester/triacylglycerol synthase family O-acyltransferase n=2 Tax=Candidatus Mycobacterium methanotrophicum TaxID=2943498 RepID=A0ABY4QJJ2_9MYCO|nr:wax ester/triacylglycerol synthase family O-acyltransferase [Candidatus Mycobacterium methanotrophicum]UQX09850.1 wax ester/triacylglycerol synthase family O-acyltransferase [Candidatus Mycobacterium methanotrophicum]